MLDVFINLGLGMTVAFTLQNIALCFIGCLIGTLVGVLPGVGPVATIAILLPVTLSLDPTGSLIMLAGIYYGAQYGGSTTAILVNIPGEATAVVTAIDGHKMAQKGQAGLALGLAAIGSFFAGTVATIVIAALGVPMTRMGLLFGPTEYFSLMIMGLVFAVVLAHGSLLKAVSMILVGVLLSCVGADMETGRERMTFGVEMLQDGIEFVVLAMGIFGFGEIFKNLADPEARDVVRSRIGRLWPTPKELKENFPAILRGTFLGSVLGVLPGNGAILGPFASYAVEKRISKRPQDFGHGAPAAVAGPESANNAGAQTSFIPLLTLGLPPNAVMALMVGAMMIQGIVPGPQVIERNPELFWGLIASMWIGNLMLVIINLPLIGLWVKLLRVPYRLLFPAIVCFCCIGLYSIANDAAQVMMAALFGIIGYALYKLEFEPAPLALGFVLGRLLEEKLRQSLIISGGSPLTFLQSPLSAILLAIAVMALVIAISPSMRRNRDEVFKEA
ncbi:MULTISPECIES: tripartite tricarboxylate transporter permease [Ensifer]|jgi:putative tricarboxylic transport membrane protein|uniref:tripartite tricarboxylate transporter permease n=1 Tax=Ensifer TaxID=106591 RepID=UPI001785562D|nr:MULTISPECIES: tripartite tricarboxylate transporter permease [Ensifer]MBD9555306.1 tripartite tricarboxylate transporter permease [Ensifer sp. ENS03]